MTIWPGSSVTTASALARTGTTRSATRACVAAGRWRRVGKAVVRHNGPLSEGDRRAVALANAGPRAVLTSFTALAELGLHGWKRDAVHLLVPAGARVREVQAAPVVVHRVVAWPPPCRRARVHDVSHAAVLAASGSSNPRTAVGVLAACVQQRLTTAQELTVLVRTTPNLRHRALSLASLADIAMGAEALSEIDFALVCRRAGLAEPTRQRVRVQPDGTRRYLDVEWELTDGRLLVAEVDGAMHLEAGTWGEDQFRQNEVTIERSVVLRFPATAVRLGDPRIVRQLRRAGVPETAPARRVAAATPMASGRAHR